MDHMAMGVPQVRWMVYKEKKQSKMDDLGTPISGNLHT